MDKQAEVLRLRTVLAEQEAWGKWNTAPTANRLAALEDELRPSWLRVARRAAFLAVMVGYCVLFWGWAISQIWGLALTAFHAIIG